MSWSKRFYIVSKLLNGLGTRVERGSSKRAWQVIYVFINSLSVFTTLCKSTDVSQRTQAPHCSGIATDLHNEVSDKALLVVILGENKGKCHLVFLSPNLSALHQVALCSSPSSLRSRWPSVALLSQMFTGSWIPFFPSVSLVSSLLMLEVTVHSSLLSWQETAQCCVWLTDAFSLTSKGCLYTGLESYTFHIATNYCLSLSLVHLSMVPPCFWGDGSLISVRM